MFKFAVQSNLVPGETLREKAERLAAWGYEGMEVSGADILERPDELRQLTADTGVQLPSACGGYQGWLIDPNPRARNLAIGQIQRILGEGAALGIPGLVVPAAYGLGARAGLPPARYIYSLEEERGRLLDALAQIATSVERTGGTLWLEPLNRYEDRVINTLAEAVEIIEALGSPQVRLMPDLYHMNIEEADPAASLRQFGAYIGHIHLADSNRMTPGLGHTDFRAAFGALRDIGYQGALAIECKPPTDPHTAFPQALAFLQTLTDNE